MREEFAYFWPYENMKLLKQEEIRPFNVQLVGRSFCDGSYSIFRPNSPIWIIEYIHSGKGYLDEDGRKFTAEKGDIYILHKNTTHTYSSDSLDPWIKTFICVYGDVADGLFKNYGLDTVNLIKGFNSDKLFNDLYDEIKSAGTKTEIEDCCLMHCGKIMQKISRFIPRSKINLSIAYKLKNYIDNIADFSAENSSFRAIVEKMNYTESHLIREFRSEFGTTPYRYMTSVKIRLAHNMLEQSSMNIGEISDRLGFCDARHFAVTYKKETGLSPSEFRKKIKINEN